MQPQRLPSGWKRSRLDSIAVLVMGQSPKGDTYVPLNDGIPLLNGPAEFGLRFPTPVQSTKSPTRLCKRGDILFCVRGNTTARMNIAADVYCIGRGLAAIRGRERESDTDFLFYALTHLKPTIYGIAVAGGSTFPNISKANLDAVELDLPSLDEQRQIALLLSALQRAVDRQEQLGALTAELKKALMHKLFTEGTRGERLKEAEIGPLPESWEIKRIADVCKLVSGGTPSKANPSFWNGSIPWASPKDMKRSRLSDVEDHISQAGLDDGSRLVPAGSIFVVIRGMILMRDVPIAQTLVPMAFNQDMKALVKQDGISSDFLLYSLQRARKRLARKVGSSAHGTRTLMTSAIEQMPIGIPDSAEQAVISQALKSTEAKESTHRRTAVRLRELFRTLLHQLMTAQVRVHDLDLSAIHESAAEPAGAM